MLKATVWQEIIIMDATSIKNISVNTHTIPTQDIMPMITVQSQQLRHHEISEMY